MTELGDRIKAYRTKNKLTQHEACARLFPKSHRHSVTNSCAVYVSGMESGRSTIGEASPDLQNVASVLEIDVKTLLKTIHADHRSMHKSARKAVEPNDIVYAAAALDEKLGEIAAMDQFTSPSPTSHFPRNTKRKPTVRPRRSTASSSPDSSAMRPGPEGLLIDVCNVIQKRAVPAILAMHPETLSRFTARVARTVFIIGYKNDDPALAEDLCQVMQQRSTSPQIRELPAKPLGEFVRRVITSTMAIQEAQ